MEATREKLDGKEQTTNKWANDASSGVMDACNKQLSLVHDFYNNLFNSFSGMNKNWMANMNFVKPFNSDEIQNTMFPAFDLFKMNSHFMNLLAAHSQDSYKQIMELSKLWSVRFQKQSQNMQENWGDLREKMHEIAGKEWKNRNDVINSITETYTKRMDFSTDLNRKFMEELNNQFSLASKRNETFCSEVMKGTQNSESEEKEQPVTKKPEGMKPAQATEKEEKKHEQPMAKKQAKVEPVYMHNHNHDHHKH